MHNPQSAYPTNTKLLLLIYWTKFDIVSQYLHLGLGHGNSNKYGLGNSLLYIYALLQLKACSKSHSP